MNRLLPPLCLLLALSMVVTGFVLLAVGPPEPSVDLHRATASGDESSRDVLQADLESKRFKRRLLLGCLFAGSAVMIAMAFMTMQPSNARRRQT